MVGCALWAHPWWLHYPWRGSTSRKYDPCWIVCCSWIGARGVNFIYMCIYLYLEQGKELHQYQENTSINQGVIMTYPSAIQLGMNCCMTLFDASNWMHVGSLYRIQKKRQMHTVVVTEVFTRCPAANLYYRKANICRSAPWTAATPSRSLALLTGEQTVAPLETNYITLRRDAVYG